MSLVDRAKNILVEPKAEWPRIAAEPATIPELFKDYAVLLALLPLVGGLLGALVVPILGFGYFAPLAIISYIVGLLLLYVMGMVADAIAPGFGGIKDRIAAMKLVVYAATPVWVAGFLTFIPGIGVLIGFAGFLYAAYLIYLGATTVLRVPDGKAAAFSAVLIVIWILLQMVIGGAIATMMVSSMFGPRIGPW